jgi:hypothetical protein
MFPLSLLRVHFFKKPIRLWITFRLLDVEGYKIANAYVFCDSNISKEDRITYLPNYLVFCI